MSFVGRQAAYQVQPATHLERAGRVVILMFDENVETRFGHEQRMTNEWRWSQDAIDAVAGGVDIFERRAVHRKLRTMGTRTSGRSVISASTPQPSSRRASSSRLTVHTWTARSLR
jgi:hypothetical protein